MSRMFCPECGSGKVYRYSDRTGEAPEDLWVCSKCGCVDDESEFDADFGMYEDEAYSREVNDPLYFEDWETHDGCFG